MHEWGICIQRNRPRGRCSRLERLLKCKSPLCISLIHFIQDALSTCIFSSIQTFFPLPVLPPVTEHKEGAADWRKTVPSYTQPGSAMDLGAWSMLPGDENQERLPKNWEMAYTETGMVYFIE